MSTEVLIAYASKHGSTAEIAEAIGEVLREVGLECTVRPAREVADLSPYTAVVIGTPIYMGKVLKDAVSFSQHHQAALRQKWVAAFVVGQSLKDRTDEVIHKADMALDPIRAQVSLRDVGMFAGVFDPKNVPVAGFFARLGGAKAEDYRDWEMIRGWARTLAGEIAALE